ncbi:unnamed protein product [Kuraishia capsulata CBS 1993]|uniref:Uncharacterized protein n=1 Tax=Kuraishia capsulata CBS 1993 TaxID=1382522 RepID=W6MSR1_9ASCO|nr:uncharacterized protein KUCA_T00005845001 [Kuraishia capsulata CBS 1993]CDK29851.1 unnamed protein product [Kuraishia capsulata CBS 1993]
MSSENESTSQSLGSTNVDSSADLVLPATHNLAPSTLPKFEDLPSATTPSTMMPPATPVMKQGGSIKSENSPSSESQTVPTTPSAPQFSPTRAGLGLPVVPRTPDRPTLSEGLEETPLLSPMGSAKRRSADFYSLLKSPERIGKQNWDAGVKRRSLELYNVINKSPDRVGFVFHDSAKSPKRQSPYRVNKKNPAEIKEISETLKTKLNYAALKVQNGWGNKSLEELEKTIDDAKKDQEPSATRHELIQPSFGFSRGGIAAKPRSPSGSKPGMRLSLDQVASRPHQQNNKHLRVGSNDEGFADLALYSALSSRKNSVSHNDEDVAEKEAVMSLMSLSSPVKKTPPFPLPSYNGTHSNGHSVHGSPPPRGAYNFMPRSSTQLPPLRSPSRPTYESAVMTDSDDNETDVDESEIPKTQSVKPIDDDDDARTASDYSEG